MYTKSYTMTFSLYDMKYPYFVNLFMTTKIESYLILVSGSTEASNLIIKSIVIFCYAPAGAVFTFNFL
jgi:hypothetical protein